MSNKPNENTDHFILRLLLSFSGLWLVCHPVWAEEPKREQIGQVLGKPVYRDQVTREARGTLADQVADAFYRPVMKKYFADHQEDLEFTDEELTFATLYFDDAEVNGHNSQLQPGADAKAAKKTIRNELHDIESRLTSDNLTVEERTALLKQKADTEKRFQNRRDVLRRMPSFQAEFFFIGPKLSRHLYEKYGGGRVISSKFGVMAFDAYHRWLAERESLGEFEITDPEIREAVKQAHLDDLASWKKQPRRGTSFVTDEPEHIQKFLNPPWLPKRKDVSAEKAKAAQQDVQPDTAKPGN